MCSKYGGMGLRSGIHTAGAQHLSSLINSAEGVKRYVPGWDLNEIARKETEAWLSEKLGKKINTSLIIDTIIRKEKFGAEGALSLGQWCEAAEEKGVTSSTSNEDRLFTMSNSGPGCSWVRAVPLSWKNWEMKPRLWVVAVKRRLRLQVAPREGACVACKKGKSDIHGEHQVTCGGRGGLIMRHNTLRDLLKIELENAGFTVEL